MLALALLLQLLFQELARAVHEIPLGEHRGSGAFERRGRMRIDEATFNIISNGLHAVAQEMGEKLVRSAYSVIIREARDCSTSLLDPKGRIIAQAQFCPIHMNSFGMVFEAFACRYDLGRGFYRSPAEAFGGLELEATVEPERGPRYQEAYHEWAEGSFADAPLESSPGDVVALVQSGVALAASPRVAARVA